MGNMLRKIWLYNLKTKLWEAKKMRKRIGNIPNELKRSTSFDVTSKRVGPFYDPPIETILDHGWL